MECTGTNTAISPRDASLLEEEITFGSAWEDDRKRESGISHMVKSLITDSEMPRVSRVAPVTSPTSASQRVNLPGVMDAEGRVDESRLRMYIFKNGNNTPVMLCPSIEITLLGAPNMYLPHEGNALTVSVAVQRVKYPHLYLCFSVETLKNPRGENASIFSMVCEL